jgi:hypothetical protein
VDRLLTRAHGLFDAPAGGSGVSTGGGGRGPVPPAPAGGGGLASGVATAGGGYEQSTAGVSGLDAELAATAAEGSSVAAQGRAGAGAIRDQARTVAAALSPMSNSAAGARLIVAAMDEHLAAMQRQLDTTTEQNKVLAVRLRQLAEAYRTAGSSGIESGHDGTTAGRGVQAVGFGTGGAPPIADTGFTAPDGTRARGFNAFMNDVGVEASALSQFSWPGLPSMGSGQMGGGFSLLPAGLASALSSPNSFIQALESANTAIANGISSGAANTYAVLLPTADSANALVTSIPSYNVNLFLNGVEQVVNGDPIGGLVYASGAPVAADVALGML